MAAMAAVKLVATVAMAQAAQVEPHLAAQRMEQVVRAVLDHVVLHQQVARGTMVGQGAQLAALVAGILLVLQVQRRAAAAVGLKLTKTSITRRSLGPRAAVGAEAVTQPARLPHQLAQVRRQFCRTQLARERLAPDTVEQVRWVN